MNTPGSNIGTVPSIVDNSIEEKNFKFSPEFKKFLLDDEISSEGARFLFKKTPKGEGLQPGFKGIPQGPERQKLEELYEAYANARTQVILGKLENSEDHEAHDAFTRAYYDYISAR